MIPPVIRVLVIDDDEEEYIVAARYLRKATAASYTVTWASSYEQGMETALHTEHEIALLDYQLGNHTGIELLQALRAAGYAHPVILLTGHGNVEIDIQAMELGAFDYIEKSDLNPKMLERSIRYAIENHRVREELRKSNEQLERRVQERTAELHRSNLELEHFAEVVAGDLQQPLRRVVEHMNSVAARAGEGDPRQQVESLGEILHSTMLELSNLDLLVTVVLEYSQTRKQREPFADVDLAATCKATCDKYADRIEKYGAVVDIGALPTIRGDIRLIRGLFANLLDNAIKYRSAKRPEIKVSATLKGDVWLCTFQDNGVGIAEEDSDEIFMMFARAGHADHAQGVGIGLPLCRKIVEYHGGHLWVDSGAEGGATFCFSLPAA